LFWKLWRRDPIAEIASQGLNAEVQLAEARKNGEYGCLELPQENFLLSYFNWSPKKLWKLRHCKSPPAFFWRYHNSSKVLSAIIRLQSEPLPVSIFLEAQNSIFSKKEYQNLKTYGIAADISSTTTTSFSSLIDIAKSSFRSAKQNKAQT
jgi:hypothetical protein